MEQTTIDPVKALRILNDIIEDEQDQELKAELRKPAPPPEKKLRGMTHDKAIERPSYEDEATKILANPTPSITEAESRMDIPSQGEVDDLLMSDAPLSIKDIKFLIRAAFRSIELHQAYIEDMVSNVNAAIESLNRKAEFLQVPQTSQKIPVRQTKSSAFEIKAGNIDKYLVDPPPTLKITRSRLKELVANVEGEWIDVSEVGAFSRETLQDLKDNWTKDTIVATLTKKRCVWDGARTGSSSW